MSKWDIELLLRIKMQDWGGEIDREPDPTMAWIGSELHLYATDRQHKIAKDNVQSIDMRNVPQIAITVKFIQADHSEFTGISQSIGMKWYAIPSSESNGLKSFEEQIALMSTPTTSPMRYAKWKATSSHRSVSSVPLLISFLDSKVFLVALTTEVIEYAGKFQRAKREWTLPSDGEKAAMKQGLVPLKHFPVPVPSSRTNETRYAFAGDTVHIEIEEVSTLFANSKLGTFKMSEVKLVILDDELRFEGGGGIQIDIGDAGEFQADSGVVTFNADREAGIELTLTGNVVFKAADEMTLTADRFRLTSKGLELEGNAAITMQNEAGNSKQIKGNRIEMNGDFPVFIVEQMPTPTPLPAPYTEK